MKLNNKGFVASTLMYSLLILFLFLILGLIALLSNRKMILDKLKNDIKEEVNSTKKYTYYENGTPIYFNPVTGKICGDYTEDNSLNETKTGCLKWYIFNDDINRSSVTMILDHNTTYKVAYNSTGSNSEMKEVKEELDKLVNESKWKVTPRLITADEIAHIVGVDSFNSKTSTNMFYFDGLQQSGKGTSKYSWLYNYTNQCESYGCDVNDANINGYWTSTPIYNTDNMVWGISRLGRINNDPSVNLTTIQYYFGVRPVISVDKKEFKKSFVTTYDFTGDSQTFVAPVSGNYKIELWGASGGYSSDTIAGKGAYTRGTINIYGDLKMYVYVGEFPEYFSFSCYGTNPNTSFNGFHLNGSCAGGGGATDVRLIKGENWYDSDSLASRIIVSGAGGGSAYDNGFGGAGGKLNGIDGTGKEENSNFYVGKGATQLNFNFGYTPNSSTTIGGGGYYGGQSAYGGNAGGGSSYISGYKGCIAIKSVSDITPICTQEEANNDESCSYHYSGLKFIDMEMIAGNESMPTHDGTSTMTGNAGNGYAKITYLGN